MRDEAVLIAPAKPPYVRARHAASLVVLRPGTTEPEMLMGMRGAQHRFMPNRLVFPGGAVDRGDLRTAAASPLAPHTRARLERAANPSLAHGLGIAAARELHEETGLSLGDPPALAQLQYLCRMITPTGGPIRFNARFLLIEVAHVTGRIGGSGELEELRFYALSEALSLDLAQPTRKVIERVQAWLGLSPEQREAEQRMPVFRRRSWQFE